MQLAAPHQPPSESASPAPRVRSVNRPQIAGNRDENMPTFFSVAPSGELPDSRLQNLVSMEAGIFAQHRTTERGDQRLRRMAEREMPCHQPCRESTCSLPVEGVEQGGTNHLRVGGQVVELLPVLARRARPAAR